MKILKLIGLIFPLLYIGCGESENKQIESNPKELQLDLLKELGLDLSGEQISIDMNKTTNFLKRMEIEMHGKADEIQHKMEKADINFTRDIGINFSDEKLEIDFNKTKNMFQQINILMKEVLLDRNSSKY